MRLILLSGGSGKRLWPLSNENRSKQFLKLFENTDGKHESMVQRVYAQIKQALPSVGLSIATSKNQKETITNQLGQDVTIVVEPERRNTFPAIALACADLYFNHHIALNEEIVVLPVDPYVDIPYFEKLRELGEIVARDDVKLALMGVAPTYPSQKYGYIVPAQEVSGVSFRWLSCFKEKPNKQEAQRLIEQGALWNCGVFAFKMKYIYDQIEKYIPMTDFSAIYDNYQKLPANSFDYIVTEKEAPHAIGTIAYHGMWTDLGTWNTLAEQMSNHETGQVITDGSNVNTHIINELDIPMVVMGAKSMIVVASPDGVLVSDKEQSSYMKPLVDQIMQRPMFGERCWGEYRVVDVYEEAKDDRRATTKRIKILKGHRTESKMHSFHQEIIAVLKGEIIVELDSVEHVILKGNFIAVAPGVDHNIYATTDVELLTVKTPY